MLRWGPTAFAIASAVCAAVVWWLARDSEQFALIRVSVQHNSGAVAFGGPLYVKAAITGVFDVRLHAFVRAHTDSERFLLEVSGPTDTRPIRQPDCCVLLSGVVSGDFRLGSPGHPLRTDTEFPFRLLTDDGNTLAEGTIECRIEPYTSTEPRLFGLIGFVSAVLSVVQFALQFIISWLKRQSTSASSTLHMDGIA